ncbi:three-helix bundle dimerization domain-containing protein [Rhodococcus sp. NPDC059968]|uniref:three-helix bundle dimerization domain-containing protein n=1 Tax=Rhodococcus sp. NPDC059968 TaxID=3347017 RepID=UPI0036703F2B
MDENFRVDVSETQHIDAVRARLYPRYPDLHPYVVDEAIDTALHRFDGCPIRDFVPLLVERAATRALDVAPIRSPRAEHLPG